MAAKRAWLAVLTAGYVLQLQVWGQEHGAYNCESGYTQWWKVWPTAKRRWCCAYVQRGCGDAQWHEEVFDCEDSLASWRDVWSSEKKDWCCEHSQWSDRHQNFCCERGRGCQGGTAFDCQAGFTGLWSRAKQQWCCRHAHPLGCDYTTSQPFDCQAGLARAQDGWSPGKKSWCCKHERQGPGCAITPRTGIHVPPGMQFLHHKLIEESKSAEHQDTITVPFFHCDDGLATAKESWHHRKKAWCCKHEAKGCSTLTTPRPTPKDFTTSPVFDCQAGLARAQDGWSDRKKRWCCRHERLGCPSTPATPSTGSIHIPPGVHFLHHKLIEEHGSLAQEFEMNRGTDVGRQARESRSTQELALPLLGHWGTTTFAASLGLVSIFALVAWCTGASRRVQSGYNLLVRRQEPPARFLEAEETASEVS